MAVTVSDRLGLTRWSSGLDAFTRTQMDDSHANLEARAAGFLEGLASARPAASAVLARFLYFSRDTGALEMCVDTDGAGAFAWRGFVLTNGATMTGRLVLKSYRETVVDHGAVAGGGTVTVDLSNGTIHKYTANGATTVAIANGASGDSFVLRVFMSPVQAVTWPAISWIGGSAPTLVAGYNVLTFFHEGSWVGSYAGAF